MAARCLLLLLLGAALVAPAQAQRLCAAVLPEAEARYTDGRFGEALDAAARCLAEKPLAEAEARRALRLAVLAHLGRRERAEAQLAALRLLDRAPDYEPDPMTDPPDYAALVYDVREAFGLSAPNPCRATQADAEVHYVEGRFGDALAALAVCLETDGIPEADAVRALRLTAMVHLQQGALEAAKRAALDLLARGYEPDPMTDPPAYVALLGLAQRQAARQDAQNE